MSSVKQSCGKLPRFILYLILFCLLSLPVKATTAVMLTDAELITHSRLIVGGRVVAVNTAWDDAGTMVWTYVEILADRLLKGRLTQRTIVLKQLGGTVGDTSVRVSGQPGFRAGERVLLYLNSGVDGSLHPAHGFMGKFSIKEDAAGTEFVERAIGGPDLEVLEPTAAGEITNRSPLAGYLEKIRRTLRREASGVTEIEAGQARQPIVAVPQEYTQRKKHSSGYTPEFALFLGGVRWMEADSGQTISYYVNPSGSPVAGGGTAEITRAMDAWPNQSGAAIRLQVAGQTGACGIRIDNTNTISFGDCLNQLDPPVGCSGIVALTAVSFTRETKVIGGTTFNRLLEADIIFNKGLDCFLATSANLAEVACHELGHSIGLDHSPDATAIMYAISHGKGRDATLSADDKAGALAIYPASGGGGPSPGGGTVSITTVALNSGIVGRSYSTTLTANGGTLPYRWSLVGGSLPPGLDFSWTGTISGVPALPISSSFAVQVVDAGNPTRLDSKWISLTIQDSGTAATPVVTGIKVRGAKKVWVFGENFRSDSQVLINGQIFDPVSFAQDGPAGQLLARGKFTLGTAGTNIVVVINSDSRSAPFAF